ncbi:MAG: hypothetical protein QXW39_06155 [Candidatus Bathyarchaeia archaeon]
MDTIMQFVYWYPPSQMTASDISGIGGDGYYGFFLVNIDLGSIGGTNIVFMPNATKSAQIVLTPDAFTAWYQNNLASASANSTLAFLYQSATEPVNGYADMNAETAAYLAQQGFYWEPYNPNYAQTYNVSSSAIDPVQQYGFTSNELYMLIRPATITTSATGTNGLATSTSLTQGALQNQTTQQQSSITNQTQNTQSGAQIVGTAVSSAVGNTLGSAAKAAELPLEYIGIGIAVVIVAVAAIYFYINKK